MRIKSEVARVALPTPIERGIESVINNRYPFAIGLEDVLCALHDTTSKDAEQDPLFRATPEAPLLAGLFFHLLKVAWRRFQHLRSHRAAAFTLIHGS